MYWAIMALRAHLLFQLLMVAQSFSIFFTIKQKYNVLRICNFVFLEFQYFKKIKNF